ncbi:MAG: InlB B-repeat-containing protein [Clostridia bacterium]|nr:InlB B-repeat-containing protein [Clostridia bacterium]
MKRFIKITCTCLAITMLLTLVLGNKQVGTIGSGCNKTKLYEYGDFIITEDNEIYDFSNQGLQKEYIVIPETINGARPEIVLEKSGFLGRENKILKYTPSIKKVYYPYYEEFEIVKGEILKYPLQQWCVALREYDTTCKISFETKQIETKKTILFINNSNIDNRVSIMSVFVNFFVLNKHFNNDKIIATRSLEKDVFNSFNYMLANIEFMYNYENAPNQGYYWIDDLETGETLTYMPKNPTREGYTFGGWYADSECTIEYDFNVPHIKKDLLEGSYTWQEEVYTGINTYTDYYLYYPEDYVTYIYAKWI